ncbi:hypothetical protein QZM46_07630 [Burkholderia vietnamiensis]|uniref:Uncharacterized protein n=1 Tax=Burkholderia vietnamiensis TaxID=60552 RepID=A0AAW7T8P2_BURVI|nr:hypothetical protein [Burkholderia vietnamiensis]MBH9645765.1 hypothetical protein [Burkholderia vietnamiensis]MBR8008228.1 hypothetical protein [Burkholderia vietnamiensis]MDN7551220.1 hypothetical protein [Burkholderia vietnamiensis]MDN7798527.1 hypothetical protein [Burkholderia vietnamiensis]MDN8044654.1 hypothetical protein [Burkholderia vietnamiensis]
MSSFHRTEWLAVASPIVTLLIVASGYVVSYMQEKGKNRAVSKDIGKLTRTVEDIKTENAARLAAISHQNAVLIEQLKATHELRFAAVDRRLQAHQEAFSRWRKLIANIHKEDIGPVAVECQAWWNDNALYLEPEVRNAFNRAYFAALDHRTLLESGRGAGTDHKPIEDNMRLVLTLGDVIMRAVALPSLTEHETKTAGAQVPRKTSEVDT